MNVVEVDNVTKSFGNIVAVKNISFEIEKGKIFGYIGPNGAGKTTTVRLLLGILKPDLGEMKLWGEKAGNKNLLSRVGALLEQDGLYSRLSAYENLRYFGEIYGMEKNVVNERIYELLEKMDLLERAKEPVKKLSKGMRRKLAIARALMHDPELLILDEPASGLDPEAQIMIRKTLATLGSEGKTILLSSHNLSDVEKVATKVGIIERGELKFLEEMKDIKRASVVEIKVDNVERAKRIIKAEELKERGWLRVTLDGELSGIISALSKAGIKIEEIEKKEKSLEELYLEVTNE
jgi:ABC-2 type transport system ATP-binding protein